MRESIDCMSRITSLSSEQSDIVLDGADQTVVIASPGSGKTRVLVERILHYIKKGVAVERIVAITFTNKAAEELFMRLKKRLMELKLSKEAALLSQAYIGTIHGFCLQILKEYPIETGIDPDFRIISSEESILLREIAWEDAVNIFFGNQENPLSIINKHYSVEAIKQSVLFFHELWSAAGKIQLGIIDEISSEFSALLSIFDKEYERQKKMVNGIDIEDQLLLTLHLLSKNQMNHIAKDRWEIILVDEYQDVNRVQALILDRLKQSCNLFLVGDPRQSIYGFRHADPNLLLSEWKKRCDNHSSHELLTNYRSSPEILNFINFIFQNLQSSGDYKYGCLKSSNNVINKPEDDPVKIVTFNFGETEKVLAGRTRTIEAEYVASSIEKIVQKDEGYTYQDIAILYRTSRIARDLEEEMLARNIPVVNYGGQGFYDQHEVRDLINFLGHYKNPSDNLLMASVLKSPLIGMTDDGLLVLELEGESALSEKDKECLEAYKYIVKRMREKKDDWTICQKLDFLVSETQVKEKWLLEEDGIKRVANIQKFLTKAFDVQVAVRHNIDRFIQTMQVMLDNNQIKEAEMSNQSLGNSVRLMTIHACKGLEFPIVFIVDTGSPFKQEAQSSIFGISKDEKIVHNCEKSREKDSCAEEVLNAYKQYKDDKKNFSHEEFLRLLFVAMTRAEQKLICVGFDKKDSWMRLIVNKLSERVAPINQDGPKYAWLKIPVDRNGGGSNTFSLSKYVDKNLIIPEDANRLSSEAMADMKMIQKQVRGEIRTYNEIPIFSVTELCQDSHQNSNSPLREQRQSMEVSKARFGNIYHSMLSEINMNAPIAREWYKLEKRYCRKIDGPGLEKARIGIESFLKNPITQQIRNAIGANRLFFRELPFRVKKRRLNGSYCHIKGQIDLIFQNEKNQWIIIDYKTSSQEASSHEEQVLLYSYCANIVLNAKVETSFLYYSESDGYKEVDVNPIYHENYNNELSKKVERILFLRGKSPNATKESEE